MKTSLTARTLAGRDTELAQRIDAALDDRYQRGYEAGRKEAFALARKILDKHAFTAEKAR